MTEKKYLRFKVIHELKEDVFADAMEEASRQGWTAVHYSYSDEPHVRMEPSSHFVAYLTRWTAEPEQPAIATEAQTVSSQFDHADF